MVRFKGALSEECMAYRQRQTMLIGIKKSAIYFLIIVPLLLIFNWFNETISDGIVYSVMMAITVLIFVVLFFCAKKSRVNGIMELDADTDFLDYTITIENKERIPTENIKKVIKIGQCYYLIRKHGDISTSLMAETSLITEGTAEEFESLFAGKIEERKK